MIRTISIALTLALSTSIAAAAQSYARSYSEVYTPRPALPVLTAPEPGQEGADQLWRQAREELNKQNYRRAAELFERYLDRYPKGKDAPDAYYWQAFALYRLNGTDDLEDARELLQEQRSRHPRAATRNEGERLLTRIRGELAQRGDSDAAEAVTRAATQAAQQGCPRRDDDDIRETALNALLQMDATSAMPLLKKIMDRRDACSAPLRRKAVFLISQQRSTEREDLLLDAARRDPDNEVREQAVFWLSQVNTDKAFEAIQEVLRNTNDRKVQERAIFALSQHRSPRAAQALREWAEGSNRPKDLRANAIFWLGQHRGAENGRYLRELYDKVGNDAELKDKIIFALSQRRGEGNERWLMDVALNDKEDIEVRKKALFWASQNRAATVQQLSQLYDTMNNREMKDQIIFNLSQRREREAVDKLMDIARKETDRELKKKAIFWLSQSKDPRVAQFLAEIIG